MRGQTERQTLVKDSQKTDRWVKIRQVKGETVHRRPIALSKRQTNGQSEGQLIWRTDGQDRQAGGQADLETDRQADRWTEGLRSLKTEGQRD